ncbi:MAG: LamG-like jellyroll fold domain-containing protein [Bacteroidales bacterium]
MKKNFYLTLLLIFSIFISVSTQAENGDTTRVQTISFDTPVPSWWGAPRGGKYKLPKADKKWSKILMYYTIKCDPNQSPACGQWDYLTRTELVERTGKLDSLLLKQPSFTINRETVEEFRGIDEQAYSYIPYFQRKSTATITDWVTLGSGNEKSEFPLSSNTENAKTYYLITKNELEAAGLKKGYISGLQMNIADIGCDIKNLKIEIAKTNQNELTETSFPNSYFRTVYEQTTKFKKAGWKEFLFTKAFSWDGKSNIIVGFSFDKKFGNTALTKVKSETAKGKAIYNEGLDHYVEINNDLIVIPTKNLADLNDEITISCWCYGDPDKNPEQSTFIWANDEKGNRQININLPWNDQKIYFDCGWDKEKNKNYDQLTYKCSSSLFEGKWTHWAFVKNANEGTMKLYINGTLKASVKDKFQALKKLTKFIIGADGKGTGHFYHGNLNNFSIWNKALSKEEIVDLMPKKSITELSSTDNLKLFYSFEDNNKDYATDESPNKINGLYIGKPQRLIVKGSDKIYAKPLNTRPLFKLCNGQILEKDITNIMQIDTIKQDVVMKIDYKDGNNPTIPVDTSYYYNEYYHYSFNDNGIATDSTLVPAKHIFTKKDYKYYGKPFEVVNYWELGRYITPYGIGLDLGEGHTWVYDVTDFAPILHDSVILKAGNNEELLDLDFVFIEGTPEREIKKITPLWNGRYFLNNFHNDVTEKNIKLEPDANTFKVKITTTGHGFDNPTNCAEFCDKKHTLKINGEEKFSWNILQECADNHLYPQGGTWIYDRAGWCPGMKGKLREFEITDFAKNKDEIKLDYDCEHDDYGDYQVRSYLIQYGEFNFDYDIAISDVISPNNATRYARFNPICGKPTLELENKGKNEINSIIFKYGIKDGPKYDYTWTGTIKSLEKIIIELPEMDYHAFSENDTFIVEAELPKKTADENLINNKFKTTFKTTRQFPNVFVVSVKANNSPKDNSYKILDNQGNVLFERTEFEKNKEARDTITLDNGCYHFVMSDESQNGLYFYFHKGQGTGNLKFLTLDKEELASENPDFGKYTSFDFTTGYMVNLQEGTKILSEVNISPNPAKDHITVSISKPEAERYKALIMNTTGQILKVKELGFGKSLYQNININDLQAGSYIMIIKDSKGNYSHHKFIRTK